jgi:hypothetical protein
MYSLFWENMYPVGNIIPPGGTPTAFGESGSRDIIYPFRIPIPIGKKKSLAC